jgi:hypothetical protein
MPTAELSYDKLETIVHETTERGTLSPDQARAVQAFLTLIERKVFDVYQADRLVASRMYDRVKIAEFWQHEYEWFHSQYELVGKLHEHLTAIGFKDLDLMPTILALGEAAETVQGHYRLHA